MLALKPIGLCISVAFRPLPLIYGDLVLRFIRNSVILQKYLMEHANNMIYAMNISTQ